MAEDYSKHLERARKYLEKNKLQDAIAEYQAVVNLSPGHPEAVQLLSDLYGRVGDLARSAHYYGIQFDRLVDTGDAARASAIFSRHLKPYPQPANRLARYAFLLQKQKKIPEAIEFYSLAANQFHAQKISSSELDCLQKIAQLDPENSARQVRLGELSETLGDAEAAGRAYLRAAQLAQASNDANGALDLYAKAHQTAPRDRSIALLFADARLRRGDAPGAVELLQPFAPADPTDTAFLELFGEALLEIGQLDTARQALFAVYRSRPEGCEKVFQLAERYFQAGAEEEALSVLREAKDRMFSARADAAFASRLDEIAEAHPRSVALAAFWAEVYNELNREVKYFDALVRLFDLSLEQKKIQEACDALDRLVEIDPYDFRIHERISKLEGKASASYLRNINVRAARATGSSAASSSIRSGGVGEAARPPANEEEKAQRALDDLMVQAEIFLQYSLQSKAVERLERIAELFPGKEKDNERLRALYERANWWPKGARGRTAPLSAAPAADSSSATPGAGAANMASTAETHRDLAEIAEITRLMYREVTPREVLNTAVREIGKYLGVRRCMAVIGAPGETPQMTAESAFTGGKAAGAAAAAKVSAALAKVPPDALGGFTARAGDLAELRELDMETALGVPLTDKDTQAAAGVLFVGDKAARQWRPNESFFLQAIGDQVMISVNHTRLRSLVRTLAVADEKTGLLGRGAYMDCLLAESKRSRTQNSPLALVILQLDQGTEILRQEGDAALETHMNKVAKALESSIRQGDLGLKYTAWSLAFVLPDTPEEKAQALAGKMRQLASQVQPEWAKTPLTLSAVVAEASARLTDENEDRVTEWINRTENGLDEIRRRGGDTVLLLAAPRAA